MDFPNFSLDFRFHAGSTLFLTHFLRLLQRASCWDFLVQTFSQSQLNTVSIVVRKGADQNCAIHCNSAILQCTVRCGVGEQWKMRPRGSCSAAVELQCCSVAELQCAAALQSRTVAVLQSCGKEGSTGAHCGKAECKSIQWQFNLMQWQYKAIQLQWRKVQMKKKQ